MNLAYQDSYQFSLIPPHAHPHRAIDETLSQGKKKTEKKNLLKLDTVVSEPWLKSSSGYKVWTVLGRLDSQI